MKKVFAGIFITTFCFSCSQQHYTVSNIEGQRYSVVSGNYPETDVSTQQLINKYKGQLDMEMSQVIGVATDDLTYGRPESPLTNLTSDVILDYGKQYTNGECDLAFMNVHGHRANLAKGNITVGNVFEVYSFENTLSIIKLRGNYLLEALESYAKMGGAGISANTRLVIKNGLLVSATINGEPIDKDKIYTIITLDYLADGNDGMDAFLKATEVIEPGITLRDSMMDYIKKQTANGKQISSKMDGRITIEK